MVDLLDKLSLMTWRVEGVVPYLGGLDWDPPYQDGQDLVLPYCDDLEMDLPSQDGLGLVLPCCGVLDWVHCVPY